MMDAERPFEILDRTEYRSRPCAARRAALHLSRPGGGRRHADLQVPRRRRRRQEGRRDDDGRRRDRKSPISTALTSPTLRAPSSCEIRGRHERNRQRAIPRSANASFTRLSRQSRVTRWRSIAGASGDHNPMHVDIDFAKAAGFPDVFAQGMLVMAYLGQALTDAVRPGRIRSFSTRFAAITQLGARLTCEGHVVELLEREGEKRGEARADDQGRKRRGQARRRSHRRSVIHRSHIEEVECPSSKEKSR